MPCLQCTELSVSTHLHRDTHMWSVAASPETVTQQQIPELVQKKILKR